MCIILYAKYIYNKNTKISSKIATQIIELSTENDSNKTVTEKEGIELVLNVSNYNDSKISEIGQNYYLEFYSDNIDISKVNITVTRSGGNIALENMKTKKTFIKANEKETHKYNIKITSNCNEVVRGDVKVKIISEQTKLT